LATYVLRPCIKIWWFFLNFGWVMAIANIEHTLDFSTFLFYIFIFGYIYSQQKKREAAWKGVPKIVIWLMFTSPCGGPSNGVFSHCWVWSFFFLVFFSWLKGVLTSLCCFWRVGDVGQSTFIFMVFEGLRKLVERLQSSKKTKKNGLVLTPTCRALSTLQKQ
jgi:hypothetical protein